MSPADALSDWLAQQRPRYLAQPTLASELVEPALQYFAALPPEPASAAGVDLALLLVELLTETMRYPELDALVARALPWAEALGDRAAQSTLQVALGRSHVRSGRFEPGLQALERGMGLARAEGRPALLAQALMQLGFALQRLQQFERSIAVRREAIALCRASGDAGPWAQMFVGIAQCERALGRPAAALAALDEGVAVNAAQQRWGAAANALSGVIEEKVALGQLEAAAADLARGFDYVARGGDKVSMARTEMRCAEGVWLAASGQTEAAVQALQEVLAHYEQRHALPQISRRLKQLAPLLARLGRVGEALAAQARAYELQLDDVREAARQDLTLHHQRLQLEHAQAERLSAEQHAAAQAEGMRRLQALQQRLVEAGKLASLGALVAGVAHELNTPLGSALTAASTAAEQLQQLAGDSAAGRLTRSQFERLLQQCQQSCALVTRSLERTIALLSSYDKLKIEAEPRQQVQLAALLRSVWQRGCAEGEEQPLQQQLLLDFDARQRAMVAPEALSEVLAQLFDNARQHAYGGGPGQVRVEIDMAEAVLLRLRVRDAGAGIAPELLLRIFDPYVSSQFGRGRSGLGLFIAYVTCSQRLGARLSVDSEPGRGSCFEIEWAPA